MRPVHPKVLISFIYFFLSADIPSEPWYSINDVENNERARTAYRSLYTITPYVEAELGMDNETLNDGKGDIYLEGIYDGMLLFANVINNTLQKDSDGLLIANQSLRGADVIGATLGLNFEGRSLFLFPT